MCRKCDERISRYLWDVTTGRKGSTDLVTLCEVPCVAPEINRETGEMEKGGIPPQRFRQVIQKISLSHLYKTQRSWKTSFRTSCDTTSTGRGKSEKTEESGSLLMPISYVFVKYLVKPLHCICYCIVMLLCTLVFTVYCTLGIINSWFWDMLSHG
jgi:hypothetical protein